ncbi:MAG: phospho-N-acetylmuramoyl-pentapeptide-transferase [Oscillospiraceae bacterium]|nr:phospho-N-acetylmuramoyl-pentapeptide-transferase [Oscillospiraceae bacterium]
MRTLIILITALISFGVTAAMGFWLIPLLRKIKFGQTILDIGPVWHKSKQGTPTMGGFLFIAGVLVSVTAGFFAYLLTSPGSGVSNSYGNRLFAGLVLAVACAFIGFVDDYIKVVKKQNLGLNEKQKMIMQLVVCVMYLTAMYIAGDTSTAVMLPFFGSVELGLFYYPLAVLVIVGTINAVNLTDGVDGLCSSVTFVAALGFMIISAILSVFEMQLLAVAAAGAMLGFLVWNFHPAKVFMGDTGSMFLGGLVVALAFGLDLEFLIAMLGIIYFCETLSVMLQVASFKLTGKRIFKMSPIHHHFEMSGWSEVKIVAVFSLVTAIGGALSVWWILSM